MLLKVKWHSMSGNLNLSRPQEHENEGDHVNMTLTKVESCTMHTGYNKM